MSYEVIAEALLAEGFEPATGNSFCFKGHISCNGEPVPIEIEVADLDFIDLPKIRIIERPAKLDGFQPHFGVRDELCYADKQQIVLDRYRPAETVIGCLEKASATLSALASKHPVNDTHEEFFAYWPGEPLLVDCKQGTQGLVAFMWVKNADQRARVMVTDEPEVAVERLQAIGWSADSVLNQTAYLVETTSDFSVNQKHWPPANLGAMLDWLKEIDSKVYDKIYHQLASSWIVRPGIVAFIIRAQNGDYGFAFDISGMMAKAAKRKPSVLRAYLLGKGAKTKVTLLKGYALDPNYLHSRNLHGRDNLRDKYILLIGCGTIGGYLASYLARLGAGQGARGKLVLVDPDILVPANLGRHVLGMNALFENKAQAVGRLIQREFPHLNVQVRPVDARDVKDLFEADLVIDATGEEALSNALNHRFLQERKKAKKVPDVLHVWIHGAGVQVMSLLVDSLDTACYRCLRRETPAGEIEDRFQANKGDSISGLVHRGCESYMPFPVSTSVQAASLAVDAALDWANNKKSPRFRSRVIDNTNAMQIKDQDLEPLSNCRACQKS